MMRRRVFLSDPFIQLAEHFVCVRMNAWLDEVNVERTRTILGWHQNTALALVSSEAPGVSIDSFPSTDQCEWQLYAHDEGTKEGETELGAASIIPAMEALARQHAPTVKNQDGPPRLPVHPDLTQTLNLAACDSRMVIVQVDGEDAIEPTLRRLIFDDAFSGTAHCVRATAEEWRAAIAVGQIEAPDDAPDAGLFAVMPEGFGRTGQVLASAPLGADDQALRACLDEGLASFREGFRKLSRSEHFLVGLRDQTFWNEYGAPQ